MSWKDQTRRRHAAERRGKRGVRRAAAMLLRQVVLHPGDPIEATGIERPLVLGLDLSSQDDISAGGVLLEDGSWHAFDLKDTL